MKKGLKIFIIIAACAVGLLALFGAAGIVLFRTGYVHSIIYGDSPILLNPAVSEAISILDETLNPPKTQGSCGENLEWNLDDYGTLTVSGTGAVEEVLVGGPMPPWWEVTSEIECVVVKPGVTAFPSDTGGAIFRMIVLPGSITSAKSLWGVKEIFYCGTQEMWRSVVSEYEFSDTEGRVFFECAMGDCGDNLTWVLSSDGTLVIIGSGKMDDFSEAPWKDKSESVNHVIIGKGVKSIGDNAFADCNNLQSVRYDGYKSEWSKVKTGKNNELFSNANIEYGSEGTCGDDLTWKLKKNKLTISGSGEMYSYSYNYGSLEFSPWNFFAEDVKEVVITEGVTTVGNYAFCGMDNVKSVELANSITAIGERAFVSCSALKGIDLPQNLTVIGEGAFYASGLTSIVIPDGVTEIGESVFEWCDALSSVDLPDGLTSIGPSAFFDSGITTIDIPDSVTSIGAAAFLGCDALSSVDLPDGLTSIGDSAFGYCSITTIDIPDSVTSIGAAAFKGCYALSSVEIPEGVTVIGDYAFWGCDALASVTVPEGGLEAIGLSGSTSLTSAKIMDGVVRISSDFFAGGVNLTEVTIPESVKLISSRAFNDCTLLTDVYFGGTEAQWAEVAVRKGNDPLLNATVHFAE